MKRHIVIGPDTKLVNIGGRPPPAVLVLLIVQLGLLLAWAFADGPAWINKHIALSGGDAMTNGTLLSPDAEQFAAALIDVPFASG